MQEIQVYAEIGDILKAEVTTINSEKFYALVELETGETALLGGWTLSGDEQEQHRIFDSLKERQGSKDGSELTVRVTDAYTDSRYHKRIYVSQRAVRCRTFNERIAPAEVAKMPANAVPPQVLEKALQRLAEGRVFRGVVVSSAKDGGKVIDCGGFHAVLPKAEFCVKSPKCLRRGTTVRVLIKKVSEIGITLTRKGIS